MNHGVTFNFGSVRVCSPAIFETCFSYDKDIWIAATDFLYTFTYLCYSIDSYSPDNTFYSFIIFSILINVLAIELSCFNTLSLHKFSFPLKKISFILCT